MDQGEINQKLILLGQVFSPSAPIIVKDLFFGRQKELQSVVDGITERGQHIILYGERGVGKTSLANIINVCITNVITSKVICNRNETFKSLWDKLLKRISLTQARDGLGFNANKIEQSYQLNYFLPQEKEVDSSDLLAVFDKINQRILFILDEFDSIEDNKTKAMFADSIKALSDSAPHVTIAVVGIAESVTDLIGEHQSIERCLKQIYLPKMRNDELANIIDNGLKVLKLDIDSEVKSNIVKFSSGFPHYTHLLSKYSAKYAIEASKKTIQKIHFNEAVSEAIDNAQESIRSIYQHATFSTKSDSMFADVLSACAIVETDEHGTFRATDLIEPLSKITEKDHPLNSFTYHLGKLCNEDHKKALLKYSSSKMSRFKIRNPLLKAFIMLKLYQSCLDGKQLNLF